MAGATRRVPFHTDSQGQGSSVTAKSPRRGRPHQRSHPPDVFLYPALFQPLQGNPDQPGDKLVDPGRLPLAGRTVDDSTKKAAAVSARANISWSVQALRSVSAYLRADDPLFLVSRAGKGVPFPGLFHLPPYRQRRPEEIGSLQGLNSSTFVGVRPSVFPHSRDSRRCRLPIVTCQGSCHALPCGKCTRRKIEDSPQMALSVLRQSVSGFESSGHLQAAGSLCPCSTDVVFSTEVIHTVIHRA